MSSVPASPGLIDRDAIYTAAEFCRRLGIGNHAWRSLRKQGLPVTRLAKRAYVRGDLFFECRRGQSLLYRCQGSLSAFLKMVTTLEPSAVHHHHRQLR